GGPPRLVAGRRDEGGGDLGAARAVVTEGQQRVARGVDAEAVVLRRAEAAVGDEEAAVGEDLVPAGVELLDADVVAGGAVEPGDPGAAVGRGGHLGLVLAAGGVGDGEVGGGVGGPLGERGGGEGEETEEEDGTHGGGGV